MSFPDKNQYARLKSLLANSKLQVTNNPAYQTILTLIDAAQNFSDFSQTTYSNPNSIGGSSDLVTLINNLIAQLNTVQSDGVNGPASATDNAIARFDGVTGKLIQNSGITVADAASGTLAGSNSGDVTLAGTPNYITIAAQVITRALVNLTSHVTGRLPYANLVAATAAATLLLRQSGSAGDWQEGTVGAGLAISGTVLNTALTFAASTYTPTLTNVANLDASTAYSCQYMRVGNTVTVSGRVDVDPTAAATATKLGISLPIASNLANNNECAGTAFASAIAGQGAAILGDATNDRAEMDWISGDVTNQPMFFSFTYRII